MTYKKPSTHLERYRELVESVFKVVKKLSDTQSTNAGKSIVTDGENMLWGAGSGGSGGVSQTYVDDQDQLILDDLDAHIADFANPHSVTKAQVGLSNVDNTSDLNKPISTSTQTALNNKQNTLVSGTNIKTINGNTVLGSGDLVITGGTDITPVLNFSALPDPTTVSGLFYWCSNSQGTSWLPGNLGGTYYNKGLYYSNGTAWEFIDNVYQASQATVNTGTVVDQFVSPSTFTNATKWNTKQDILVSATNIKTINGVTILGSGDLTISGSGLTFKEVQRTSFLKT